MVDFPPECIKLFSNPAHGSRTAIVELHTLVGVEIRFSAGGVFERVDNERWM